MGHALRMTPEEYKRLQARKTNRAGVEVGSAELPPGGSRPGTRASKYGNVKVRTADGEVVDSKKEFQRRQELALAVKAGAIRDLRHNVPFAMVHAGVLICTYRADHVYFDLEKNALVVEDTKSAGTRKEKAYRLKVKMMLAFHELNVLEV